MTPERIQFESALLSSLPHAPDLRMNDGLYRHPFIEARWKGWNIARKIPEDLQPLADYYQVNTLEALAQAQARQIDSLLRRIPSNPKQERLPPPT